MLSRIAEGFKTLLGLSGLTYIAGFILVSASFLAHGVAEASLFDANYIAAGAMFLFLALPAAVFPYLRGIASLNAQYQAVSGSYISPEFQSFFDENKAFLQRITGPFLITVTVIVLLPELAVNRWKGSGMFPLLAVLTMWYVCSSLFSRLAACVFNLGFYWRLKMVRGRNPFWQSFGKSFVTRFKVSFQKSFQLTSGQMPTAEEIDAGLNAYIGAGLGARGFLISALYKGIALFLLSAVTFGWFVYPLVPASIGGGRYQTIVLLLSGDQTPGLRDLGLTGRQIEASDKSSAAPAAQFLTTPLPLLAKTSEAYFVVVSHGTQTSVVKIPIASVEGVAYTNPR
jgi:hypothetical protein